MGRILLLLLCFVLVPAVVASDSKPEIIVKTAAKDNLTELGEEVLKNATKPGPLPILKIPQRPSAAEILGLKKAKAVVKKAAPIPKKATQKGRGIIRRILRR